MNTPSAAESEARLKAERRSQRLLWIGSLVAALLLFVLALRLMGPTPPRRLRIGAGPLDGQYHHYALRYREEMAKDGIEIEVVTTEGSIENLERLAKRDVDVAFVQGGTARAQHLGPADGVGDPRLGLPSGVKRRRHLPSLPVAGWCVHHGDPPSR